MNQANQGKILCSGWDHLQFSKNLFGGAGGYFFARVGDEKFWEGDESSKEVNLTQLILTFFLTMFSSLTRRPQVNNVCVFS